MAPSSTAAPAVSSAPGLNRGLNFTSTHGLTANAGGQPTPTGRALRGDSPGGQILSGNPGPPSRRVRVAADTGTTRSPAGKTRRWLSWTVLAWTIPIPQFVARTPGNTRRGLLSNNRTAERVQRHERAEHAAGSDDQCALRSAHRGSIAGARVDMRSGCQRRCRDCGLGTMG